MADKKVDYYEVLGITDEEKKLTGDAFADVVKKHYKKLAIKYHPDKWSNGTEQEKKEAEEKFKQINEANMVLSDPQKRERYDMGDTSGFDFPDFRAYGGYGFNPFGDDFDPFSAGFNFFNRGQRKQTERGSDLKVSVGFTLQEALNGGKKTVRYQKQVPCSHCSGTGFSDGKDHKCPHCNGTGRIVQTSHRGNTTFQNITGCPYCGGTGRDMSNTSPKCSYCGGTGMESISETIDIEIPQGVFDGASIRLVGRGCEPKSRDGVKGDLVVVFYAIDDDTFDVDGNNLTMRLELDLDEALCGCEKEIKTLDGHTIKIKIPELTEYGKVFRVPGRGIRNVQYGDVVGDLFVEIIYKKIDKITEKQKKLIREFYGR